MDSPKAKYDSPEQRAALFDAINKNCGVNAEGKISLENLLHFVREEIEVKFVDSQSLILRLTRSLQHGARSGLIDFEDVCKIFQTWLEKQSSISQFKIIKPTYRSEEVLSTPNYPLASSTPYTLRKELSFISHDSSFREETFYSACDSCGRDGSCCDVRSEVEKSSREENVKKYYEQKLQDIQNLLEHSEECNSALQNEVENLRETCNIYKSKEKRWSKTENQLVDREQQLSKLNNLLNEQKTAVDAEVQRLRQQVSRLRAENENLLSQCVLLEESKVKQNKIEKILTETKTKLAKVEIELNDKVTLLEIREENILQLENENKKLQEIISSLQMPGHSKEEGADDAIDPILGTSDESPERIPVFGNYLHIYPNQISESMTLKEELQQFMEVNLKPCENTSTQTTQVQYECVSTQTVCVDSLGNVYTHTNYLSSRSTQITNCMTKNESTQYSPILSNSHIQTDELVSSESQCSEAMLRKDHCAQFPCGESVNIEQSGCGPNFHKKQCSETFESSVSSSNLAGTFTISTIPSLKTFCAQSSKISTKDKSLLNTDSQTEKASLYCTTYEIPIYVMEDVSTQVDSIFIETEKKNERSTQTEKTIWHSEVPVPAPRAVQHFSNDPFTTFNPEEQAEHAYQSEAAAEETDERLEADVKGEDDKKCPAPPQAMDNSEATASLPLPPSLPRNESVDSNNNAAQDSVRVQGAASLRPPTHGSTPRSSRPGSSIKETNVLGKELVNMRHNSGRTALGFGVTNDDGLPVIFFPGSNTEFMKSSWILPLDHELQWRKPASQVSHDSPETQHDSGAETSQELFSESEGAFARGLAAGREARRREWAGREARAAAEAEAEADASEDPPERARRRQRSSSSGRLVEAMAALSISHAARGSPRRFGLEGQSKESSNTLRINEASQHVLSLLPTGSGSSEELFFSAEINKPYHDSSTSLQSNSGFLSTCKMESTDSLTFETVTSSCNNSSGTFNKVKVQKKSKKMYSPVSTSKTGKKGRKFSAQSTMAESVGQKARESKSYFTYAAIFALLAASWFYLAFTCPCDGIVYHTLPYTMDRLRELFSIKYVYPYGPPPV